MRPILLAISFMRVPRLFVSLLFWPMVVGFGIALLQAITSSAYFGLVNETTTQYQERLLTDTPETKWIREKLFGVRDLLPEIQTCRWQSANGIETPPAGCELKPFDIVVRSDTPDSLEIGHFVQLFNGATRSLHVCRDCSSEIIISTRGGETVSDVQGLRALGVYMLSDAVNGTRISSHYIDAKAAVEHLKDISGTVYLHPEGAQESINMTQATKTMILIINTSLIIIIALWLSLKGHRKVLDYFARNGALLPLVAACGKRQFYTALWIITLCRVAFFLIAALPATVLVYARAVPDETLAVFMRSGPEFILWLCGIITSLACLAIIASIAELKHRHSWVSFMYRYVPLFLCMVGTGLWSITLLFPDTWARVLQSTLASIPVVGISPILLSPMFRLDPSVIALHSTFAAAIVLVMLRANSRWFAAHLEEI